MVWSKVHSMHLAGSGQEMAEFPDCWNVIFITFQYAFNSFFVDVTIEILFQCFERGWDMEL